MGIANDGGVDMKTWTREDLEAASQFKERARQWTLPLLFADVVILTVQDDRLKVLLTLRGAAPEKGKWSLPGVMVRPDSDRSMTDAAMRAAQKKTATVAPYLEQLRDFSGPDRDPRGWSTSYAYLCLMPADQIQVSAGCGAEEARLFALDEVSGLDLAFDHGKMLDAALVRIRNKVNYSSLPAHLLGPMFTLTELMRTYEVILGQKLDKSAFRKKMKEAGFVRALDGEFKTGANRPAQLFAMDQPEKIVMFRRNLTP
jgi:8-oxo-dGTP diphosphatase